MRPFVIEENKWRIASKKECYVLQEARTVKGKLKWEAAGYYVTLGEVLEGCLRKSVRLSEEELPKALREAVEVVSTAAAKLRQASSIKVKVPRKEYEVPRQMRLLV